MIMMRGVVLAFVCFVLSLLSSSEDETAVHALVLPPNTIAMTTRAINGRNRGGPASSTSATGGHPRVSSRLVTAGCYGGVFLLNARRTPASSDPNDDNNKKSTRGLVETVVATAERTLRIIQQSQRDGAGFKQIMANVLAGDEYDTVAVNRVIDEAIQSAPIVLFTWAASPSCQQALRALDLMNISPSSYRIVRLDSPWDQGHAIRAELGRRQQGKCSVPAIYINGQYIGGYDSGISLDRPGWVDLALTGILSERLRQAGVVMAPVIATTTTTSPIIVESNDVASTTRTATTTIIQPEMSTLE